MNKEKNIDIKEEVVTSKISVSNQDLAVLKKYSPQYFDKNGNFNFDKFKKELSENEVNFSKESYGMDWLGKSYARLLASSNPTTLLKEDEKWNQKKDNKDSENLLIKGDNLEVLKHLSNAYHEKVKMIYIDPPYNTGSDGFVYEDDRKFTPEEFQKLAGVDKEKAKKILDFVDSKSNSHSAWLTFMYPRLYIAKQLLKDEGVIFVSIDDNEVAQLRLLMDEVFGEENFVGILSIENNPKGRKNSDFISISNDFVLIYTKHKNKSYFIQNIPKEKDQLEEDEFGNYYTSGKRVLVGESSNEKVSFDSDKHYSAYYNSDSNDLQFRKEKEVKEISKELIKNGYVRYLSVKNNNFIANTYTQYELEKLYKKNALLFKKNSIYAKDFNLNIRLKSIVYNRDYIIIKNNKDFNFKIDLKTETAGKILKKLGIPFDMPKNPSFIKLLITLFEEKDFLILDFFAGSGTTADAVMQLNAEDGGNRKYILAQLPEAIDEKKNKTAYDFVKKELKISDPTIFDITKERIIRAGKKIKDDNEELKGEDKKDLSSIDFGFKVFETTPIWDNYDFKAEELDPNQKLFNESILTKDDLKTLLTTWKVYDGIQLTKKLEEINLDKYQGYYFDKKLYLLDIGFETKNLKKLLEKIDEDENFNPSKIIAFGFNFDSKSLREISENIKTYANKKHIDIDFITRY